MAEKDAYILAMYDIRGKQEFIYKSNKIKEIVGASYIIRDCFQDYLYPAAREYEGKGLFNYKEHNNENFTYENFERHIKEDGYIGEVVYDGGGNFFVLYRDIDTYREVNRRFYRKLLEGTYSLKVLTTYIDAIHFDDYPSDQRRLYTKHRKREQTESLIHPVNTLPIVQTDNRTSLPLSGFQRIGDEMEKVAYESKRKYIKYEEIAKNSQEDRQIQGSELLDELITKKGEKSLLAVIYIDGNNMGSQVEQCLGGEKSYQTCIKALRDFSDEIQKNYIDERIKDVDLVLEEKEKKDRRFLIYAGDETTFICNAENAYEVAVKYLQQLAATSSPEKMRTSCAGIAVFHSHAPFSEAYRIAEECCESGKQLMKKEKIEDASLIDFHYCQGAFGTSLEAIRKDEETTDSSRPWFITYRDSKEKGKKSLLVREKYVTDEVVQKMRVMLNMAGRSNIKRLLFSAKKNLSDFQTELERITAHQTECQIDFTLGGLLDAEMQRRLIYDMATVYDLWFCTKEAQADNNGQTDNEKKEE